MKIITQHCTPQRRSLFPAFTVLRALLVITSSLLGVRTAFAEEPLDRQITINISANTPLEDALIEWGLKARVTVMTNSEVVAHYLTKHVSGTLTARRALALLLEDTHLY